ncbi:WD40-like repeat protein [Natrialba hulunbeirensis JCM 10989]|uniref:WD40-like repeat protein n=1 Tax=Natrialba hulunbeirensis JCM 10989 TaxID=1227493 RepID=M0A8D8_9EURY|nr:PQQ-binding-like beta-propeller repeat protein [Natrialba hulunbeirensis]ELY94157.1 WD40-like repeat protein [Natrialba hulunbeirensis JCM 10989]
MPSCTRRRALTLLGAASAGLAGCLSRGAPSGDLGPVDGEWPVDGSESGRTRSVSETPAEPAAVWTTELEDVRATRTPSIADERIYVPADAVSDRARHRYQLHALAAGTGKERWRVSLRSDPNASPAVASERVIVSAQRGLEAGRLVGFEKRDGGESWLYDIDARVTASPMIDRGTVYLPDWDGYVHALSVADGSVQWSRQVGADESNRTVAKPVAVHDETLFVGGYSGRAGVLAVDAATGDDRWAHATDRVIAGPVVDDELVVVQAGSVLTAFERDGTERWTFNVVDDYWETPLAMDDEHIYVSTVDTLHAITRGGEHGWEYPLSERSGGPPTVVGDEVLISEDGTLTALARTDGEPRWRLETDGNRDVVAIPDAIFMRESGGRLTSSSA